MPLNKGTKGIHLYPCEIPYSSLDSNRVSKLTRHGANFRRDVKTPLSPGPIQIESVQHAVRFTAWYKGSQTGYEVSTASNRFNFLDSQE